MYCVGHVAIRTVHLSDLYIHTHTRTHTHAHTDTQTHPHTLTQIKILQFFGKKFKFFSENIRSNKDSGQIEKNELTS